MRNQRSWRTKSRLKAIDNSVKISQVIGKKDSNWQPFYPSFTNTTVVLVSEDKRTYETTKATADWAGNLTFLKRWLADDWTDVEVAKFKRAWMPWTLMYITFASEDYDNKPDFSDIPTKTSDLTNDSWFIDNTVNDLVNYTKTSDLWAVATSNDYNDLDNKLTAWANITIDWNNEISATDTIPNNATIKIQKNWTDIESFTANESTNKTINITVPTQASDIWALPDTTKYWSTLSLSINSTTYVVTAQLKDQDWNNLWTEQTIDLPLESVVISGSYDDVNKKIVLTLQSWSTVEFSVADLVSWLQTEITNSNKLDADLVDDSTSANKFVTASDLTKLSNTSGVNTWDQTASDFDIKDLTDSTNKMTSWDSKLGSWDDVSELVNDAWYLTSAALAWYQTTANMVQTLNSADHDHYPTAKAVSDAITSSGWWDMLAATYDPTNVAWDAFDTNNMNNRFFYWESSTAAATVQKEVSIPSITSLNVWQVIIVKPSTTSSVASSTLKLNSFPAYKMLYNGAEITTSTDSIVWSANVPSLFYLDEVSGTKYWRFLGHWLDNNTTYTINYLHDAWKYKAWTGTYAITRYSLCMMKADGTWEKLTATNANYTTATTKTVNTNWFVLNQIKYYNTTTTVANWAFVGTNAFSSQAASVRADYSFNCGTAPWWAVWDPIYIVWTIWADWLFYLDTTARWTTTLPSTNNWKLYIRIWVALTTTDATASFLQDRPIFYYDNWIKEYTSSKQDKLTAWSNITISWTTISATDTTYVASDFDIKDLTDSTSLMTTRSGKQNALVDWTNIKTVNWQNILGSGNLTVWTVMTETDYGQITPVNWVLYFTTS